MCDDVELYVKTCLICQQDKVEQNRLTRLLESLPIPERPWENVSMDFIVELPTVDVCGNILVRVDQFNNYEDFILILKKYNVENATRLFFKHVVKY
ncbi:hypothetical protein V6N13_072473 [Hibiscus sabdariffa]